MTLSKGNFFDPELVSDLINKVKGKSSLAALSQQVPIPFNGQKEFTFTMDSEIDIVAENAAKSHGGISIAPITIIPIKVEYGARVSDEFLYAAEEDKINIIKAFNDGYAKKLAKGLDLMAMHGINPRSGEASAVIGANNFDSKVTQMVTYTSADPDANIEAAVALVQGANGAVNGVAMSPVFSAALAAMRTGGDTNIRLFPELAWGANPGSINGLKADINGTVSAGTSKDLAILGDFTNMFKWGYAKQIPFEVIKYGDPDNSGRDLKGYNQVYLRSETYLGWGIMDASSFARIVNPTDITFTAVQVGGVSQTTDTASIAFTFSEDVHGLSAANITLTDGTGKATKGVLTGSGKSYSLTVTAVEEGNITVKIANIGGYAFPTTAATVAVYAEGE
jgi:hypothetical protein